jgi:hypothetical protein
MDPGHALWDTKDAVAKIKGWTGVDLESPPPHGKEEAFRRAGIEGLGGSAASLGRNLPMNVMNVLGGVGGGLAQQGASSAGLGEGSQLTAGILTNLLATAPGLRTPQVVKAARTAAGDLTPEMAVKAEATRRQTDKVLRAEETGGGTTLGQALEPNEAPNLKGLEQAVMASDLGSGIKQSRAKQMIEMISRGRNLATELAPWTSNATGEEHRIQQALEAARTKRPTTPGSFTRPDEGALLQKKIEGYYAHDPLNYLAGAPSKDAGKVPTGNWERFTAGLDKLDAAAVHDVAQRIRMEDPQGTAFAQIVKNKWDEAAKVLDPKGDHTPGNAPAQFIDKIAGTMPGKKREAFLAQVEEAARGSGMGEGQIPQVVKGANELADALVVGSRGRGNANRFDEAELGHGAGRNIASTILRPALSLERILYRRTFAKLSNLFTSPDGYQQLMDIANYNSPKEKALVVARSLITQSSAQAAGAGERVELE